VTDRGALPFVELDRAGEGGRAAWWRYLLSILLILVLGALGAAAVVTPLAMGAPGLFEDYAAGTLRWDDARAGELLLFFVVTLGSVIVLLPVTLGVVRVVHGRPVRTLLSANRPVRWDVALASFGATVGLMVAIMGLQLVLWPEDFALRWRPWAMAMFLPAILILIPFQALAEEALFRGYVQQTVARATGATAVRLVVPAILFTALHGANPEAAAAGPWAFADWFVLGLYMGWLALRGNGLEAPAGFHAGLNVFLAVFVALPEAALITPGPIEVLELDLALNLLSSAVLCALHWALLRRMMPAEA